MKCIGSLQEPRRNVPISGWMMSMQWSDTRCNTEFQESEKKQKMKMMKQLPVFMVWY